MRTTLNISDDLYRRIKIRAVERDETVTAVVEDALQRLLEDSGAATCEPFRLEPLRGGGQPLPGVDLHDNALLLDLLDEGVPLEQLR